MKVKNTGEIGGEKKEKRKPLFVLSFFIPPILTVFYLIELCDKEQKKERLRRRLHFLYYKYMSTIRTLVDPHSRSPGLHPGF